MIRIAAISLVSLALAASGQEADTSHLEGAVTAIVFLSARCPVSNAYGARLESLYEEYGSRGVRFLFLNANSNESAAEIEANAKLQGFRFPVYRDPESRLAARFGARLTPEAVVLDRNAAVRYRGAIDDAPNPARVKTPRLRLALDAVLAGKPAPEPETKAFGCTIKRPRAGASLQPLDIRGYRDLVAAQKGKVLLVDFWATWCAPCREELPRIAALAARLPAASFRLATVSADEPEQSAAALKLLHAAHVPAPFFQDHSEDHDRFIDSVDPAWSGALPALFLYDRTGRLARYFPGEAGLSEIEAAIRKLL